MKTAKFTAEITSDRRIQLPPELRDSLKLESGDHVEVTVKKIVSRRLEVVLSHNPLYKLFQLKP